MTRLVPVPEGPSLQQTLDAYAKAVEARTGAKILCSFSAPHEPGEQPSVSNLNDRFALHEAKVAEAKARDDVTQAALRLARFAADVATGVDVSEDDA